MLIMHSPASLYSLLVSLFISHRVAAGASSNQTLVLPSDSTYKLPFDFVGNASQSFLQTHANNSNAPLFGSVQDITKPFVVYDQEFADLLAPNASLELVYASPDGQAVGHEMGIWVWDHNQVWMASMNADGSSSVNILDLANGTITPLEPSNGVPVLNPNGGGYHDGKVYIAGNGNATAASAIYTVDPVTYEVAILIDSYFDLRLNGPNDLTWATTRSAANGTPIRSWMFFSDDPLNNLYDGGPFPQLPDAT